MKLLVVIAAVFAISAVQGCGRPALQGSRIIGGTTSRKGDWPWQVMLYYDGQFICGGSLLNSRWVLTAAHCVEDTRASGFMVGLGVYNMDKDDDDATWHRADRAFTHPDVDPDTMDNDVALIRMRKPVRMTRYIQPACLTSTPPAVGSLCYITGWGQTRRGETGPLASRLKQARLEVVSKRACAKLNTPSTGLDITDQMVCGRWHDNRIDGGCHGDSGGPFVCKSHTGRWELQGAVSWGPANCDNRHGYSVFAKVAKFKRWIDSQIN